MTSHLRISRRGAWIATLVAATLLLWIVFDRPVFATLVLPAIWAATLGAPGCGPRASRVEGRRHG